MNLYKFTYSGWYPVGACGVVLARNYVHALILAEEAIRANGQSPDNLEIEMLTHTARQQRGWVILDGNY